MITQKIITYDKFNQELQNTISIITNHINLNFVNEIIKYIENIENINSKNIDLIREDFNNIQENQKLNLKNDHF